MQMNENENKWIQVSIKLPFVGQNIIATLQSRDKSIVTIIKYDGTNAAEGCRLTAWMPLPESYASNAMKMYKVLCTHLRRTRRNEISVKISW